eukprot:7207155-Prymnesium_polylepis.2
MIITLGTPARAPVPRTTLFPRSMPPDKNVSLPTAGALSSAVMMVDNDGVRAECVTTVVSNSTYAICAAADPIVNSPTSARANSLTVERCDPTLPELSITRTMSTSSVHGGGEIGGDGGSGGIAGGNGRSTPHSWTASICSNPETSVVTLIVSVVRLPS